MAVPQPLLNQRPILEPSKIKTANAFTREDVVSTKALLDFAHLYKKNLVDNLSCMQT